MKMTINNNTIHFENVGQVINMGGPWIGDLLKNDNLLVNNVYVDSLVFDSQNQRLFFIKYHLIDKKYFFTINFYDVNSGKIFQYEKKFKIIFLGKIKDDNTLEIYDAFHDQFPEKKRIFYLNNEPFIELN